ncbi:MAG: HDOD domain-containing protein [Candidatus Hydrogenedentes bacterium]|nr:HDOD domain-containing protein [Candidatus Hydrogenedentota bacterium]
MPCVEDALTRLKGLPALPTVMSRILATIADPDASALDLSPHISADQSLTASLLRIVNSVYYGHYRRVANITSAIVMLGFREVCNLALATTTFRTFLAGHAHYDRTQLWRHSLAAAMAAERLANALGMPVEGCFVSGLLHDIGKVVFDVLYPERFQQAIREAHTGNAFIRDIEPRYLGMDHAAVGRLLAEQWDLPPSVVNTIAHHHKNAADRRTPSLADVVSVANIMTYRADLGEASNGRAPEGPSDGLFGLTAQQWDALAQELAESRPRIDEFLGALA